MELRHHSALKPDNDQHYADPDDDHDGSDNVCAHGTVSPLSSQT